MLRRWLIAFLMLALPVQGALASSRWLCVAMSQTAPMATAAHEHSHADSSGSAHEHVASGAKHNHDRSHGNGNESCSLCAACTVTVATPPALIALAEVEAASLRFPSLDSDVPRFGTRGPERPPRTI